MSKRRVAPSSPMPTDQTAYALHQVEGQARSLLFTHWHIGRAVKRRILTDARVGYGDATMQKLADRLMLDYGPGFGRRNLFRLDKLYRRFDELAIVTTLSTQLSRSHLVAFAPTWRNLIPCHRPLPQPKRRSATGKVAQGDGGRTAAVGVGARRRSK